MYISENVTEPTLELTSEQLINKKLYDSYYFNVVSVDNIGRSGNSSENSTSFSIGKIMANVFIYIKIVQTDFRSI